MICKERAHFISAEPWYCHTNYDDAVAALRKITDIFRGQSTHYISKDYFALSSGDYGTDYNACESGWQLMIFTTDVPKHYVKRSIKRNSRGWKKAVPGNWIIYDHTSRSLDILTYEELNDQYEYWRD